MLTVTNELAVDARCGMASERDLCVDILCDMHRSVEVVPRQDPGEFFSASVRSCRTYAALPD